VKKILPGVSIILILGLLLGLSMFLYQAAYEEGKQAFIYGLPLDSNPYICVFTYNNTVNQIQLNGWFKGYLNEKQKCGSQSIQEKPSP